MKIILEAKREAPHHPSPPFKEKEKGGEGRIQSLVAIGRIQSLVAIGMFQAWWPLEGEG